MRRHAGADRRPPEQAVRLRGVGATTALSPSLRGAKRRSNPAFFAAAKMDCFASLAMTMPKDASLAMTDEAVVPQPHAALRPRASSANTTASAEATVYIMKALR